MKHTLTLTQKEFDVLRHAIGSTAVDVDHMFQEKEDKAAFARLMKKVEKINLNSEKDAPSHGTYMKAMLAARDGDYVYRDLWFKQEGRLSRFVYHCTNNDRFFIGTVSPHGNITLSTSHYLSQLEDIEANDWNHIPKS